MAEVIQWPLSPPVDITNSTETLTQTLDDLFERYLSLLDQYQTLRQNLTEQVQSGFFDLAKANFSNPNRIRYGQDFYDERMQATSRVTIESPDLTYRVASFIPAKDQKGTADAESSSASPSEEKLHEHEKKSESAQVLRDPITWFGLLIPHALRSSQASFKIAVTDSIPALVNVDRDMKELEIEIRRTKKRLNKLR